MPRAGDQAKKGKRKGRNKQEMPAYAEPSAHAEEVKTPLDLAKVSVCGTRGQAVCHWVLRARCEPASWGKVTSNTNKRCDWKAEISFQKYASFVIRVPMKAIMYLKACLCFPATSQGLINACLPPRTLSCLIYSTASVRCTFVCLCSLIDSMQRGSRRL